MPTSATGTNPNSPQAGICRPLAAAPLMTGVPDDDVRLDEAEPKDALAPAAPDDVTAVDRLGRTVLEPDAAVALTEDLPIIDPPGLPGTVRTEVVDGSRELDEVAAVSVGAFAEDGGAAVMAVPPGVTLGTKVVDAVEAPEPLLPCQSRIGRCDCSDSKTYMGFDEIITGPGPRVIRAALNWAAARLLITKDSDSCILKS